MAIIKFSHKGDFSKTERFFNRALRRDYLNVLEKYGQLGVSALQEATPKDTGTTANSWDYGIEKTKSTITLYWTNSNENRGISIVYLLVHGHGTQNGGYIVGNDFVTPALQPIFEELADKCWKEVTR